MSDPEAVKDLARAIVEAVEVRTKNFLDAHQDAKDFLLDRAERLARLAYEYSTARNNNERALIESSMGLVRQTIENEASTIAVLAQKESKDLFLNILGTALDTLVKALPSLVALI